jgi:hypothetical protein
MIVYAAYNMIKTPASPVASNTPPPASAAPVQSATPAPTPVPHFQGYWTGAVDAKGDRYALTFDSDHFPCHGTVEGIYAGDTGYTGEVNWAPRADNPSVVEGHQSTGDPILYASVTLGPNGLSGMTRLLHPSRGADGQIVAPMMDANFSGYTLHDKPSPTLEAAATPTHTPNVDAMFMDTFIIQCPDNVEFACGPGKDPPDDWRKPGGAENINRTYHIFFRFKNSRWFYGTSLNSTIIHVKAQELNLKDGTRVKVPGVVDRNGKVLDGTIGHYR